ncbi:MAG: hypothetical protein CMO40_02780 [Verrucomicrobiaceae bacterium]|nr:hypothetical protein [Verrucomicrobiaceae bacterium]
MVSSSSLVMNRFILSLSVVIGGLMIFTGSSGAQQVPAVFGKYLKLGEAARGQLVVVEPPKEISTYVKKVEKAARADPEWFKDYSKNAKPGVPLPFHEKLGLTEEEYALYNKLWDERKMTPLKDGNVVVRLEQPKSGEWMIRVSGKGASLSLLRYRQEDDVIKSPNGLLTRLDDINADPRSILGNWTGHEWRFQEEDSLGKTKENFAIGSLVDTRWGLLVYRLQSTSPAGRLLFDRSMVIRFPMPAE